MRKEKEKKNFWNKYKNLQLESRFDKSRFDKYNLDKQSANEKILERDNKKRNNIQERLKNNNWKENIMRK